MPRKRAPWYRKARRMWHASVDGKQVPLGVTDPADEAAAWAVFQHLLSAAKAGTPPGGGDRRTCGDAVAAFLADRAARVKPDTLRGYARMLARFAARFGTVPLGGLDPAAVEADARGRPWSDTHRANYLCTVEQAARWAGRKDFRLSKPEKQPAGPDVVIPEDVHRLVLVATRGDWRQVVRFLWLTGCRPGEAAAVTADLVDWAAGVVHFKDHKTRHKRRPRLLYLCPEALAVLREQRAKHGDGGHLFRGKGGRPFSRAAFTMKFQRISERVGRRVTSYGYRHSFATRALEKGVPEAQVAALLGHATTAMLFRNYSHLTTQARTMKAVAARLNEPPPDAA
jgi:integrase